MPARRPLQERFWEKVNKDGPIPLHCPELGPCWLWTASKDGCGYGWIGLGNRKLGKAHQVSWELHFGPIPEDKCVLHHCDLPECSNPRHLFLGTQKDNALDRESKGRGNHATGVRCGAFTHPECRPRGPQHGNARLSEMQVREIRQMYTGAYGEQKALAKKYGVDIQTIRRITQGKSYTNVEAT